MTIEDKIGFTRIRELVAAECSNELAVRMTQEMTFSNSYDHVVRELQQTEEFRQILMLENSFPRQDFIDLTTELNRLRVEGTVIELEAMADLKASLHTIGECLRFLLRDDPVRYPMLYQLATRVEWNAAIGKALNKIVDDKGEVYDNASDTLLDIRRQMTKKRNEVDIRISRQLARAKHEGWAPENAEATIRNGRMVIPMLDTHRRKIKGLIHDESATRQTAYVEPSEVVELGNDLRELEFAERHEIQKILAQFTDWLRPQLDALVNAYWFLARIDFIRAKARFALTLHAGRPIVDSIAKINWLDARHPLLYLKLKEKVVPFNIELDDQAHILIVSGPNAGGKSVCLKAVGLIQYMLQCGMLVPCRETSEFGIFDSIFIDIGDQQSIDNDLSTYTSHLQNMKQLLETADEGTLFLLDELGGGTEPRSGCAIAEAVLEELHRRHAYGMVTTHYADLKLMADHCEGIRNGAMLFDTERMQPLYRLAIGHPGSSFAFEIAQNIGFPSEVLQAASEKVGDTMLNFEHQLQQLELDKQEVARQRTELEVADNFLAEVTDKYQRLNEQLEGRKHEILSNARKEAQQILADANRTVEQTISDIKSAQAERERTMQARQRMKAEAERLATAQEQHDEQLEKMRRSPSASVSQVAGSGSLKKGSANDDDVADASQPIVVGSIVRIDGQDTFGEVVEIKGKKAVVESNSIRMTIALNRLTATQKKAIPVDKLSRQNNRFQSIYDDINEKRKTFNPTIDLRGQRADEAMENLQHFLDDAQLLSEKELRILHGKGYGVLKQIIRDYLMGNRDVKSFHSERLELGGDGITVVHLK
ncbi:MAG: Smr/MutS family protein [Bacteroidales bacterium]|nr:Smr/MutS family protein [Bacteroidales bacterium]